MSSWASPNTLAGSGELGRGFEDPADQEGKDEITATIAVGAEDTVEADPAGSAESRGNGAVRRAGDGSAG